MANTLCERKSPEEDDFRLSASKGKPNRKKEVLSFMTFNLFYCLCLAEHLFQSKRSQLFYSGKKISLIKKTQHLPF